MKVENPKSETSIAQAFDDGYDHVEGKQAHEQWTLLDLAIILAKHKATILKVSAACGVVALLGSFLLPNVYTAKAKILPPQQSQSLASSLMGQLGPLAGLVGGKDLGLKSQSDLYVAVLQSRTVQEALVRRFDLMKVYDEKWMTYAREDLAKQTDITLGKDGFISISVDDTDPKRSADLVNAYLEELYKLNQVLAVTEASQRRAFFQKELLSAKDDLSKAELELKKTQESTGLIQLDGQAKAIIDSVARIKGEIVAKEVQLKSIQSFATNQNPDLLRLQQELSALRSQLSKMESGEQVGNGDIQIPTGKVPTAGLEYVRKLRDVKYYETIFELLAKQFEVAKIEESKSAPLIQILDSAVPPEKKSKPQRTLIALMAAIFAGMLTTVWVVAKEAMDPLNASPRQLEKIARLQNYF